MAELAKVKAMFREHFDPAGTGIASKSSISSFLQQLLGTTAEEVEQLLRGSLDGSDDVRYEALLDEIFGAAPGQGRRGGHRLAGKVAIVTGAGSSGPGWGTGKAMAVLFAREGAKVGLVDLNTAAAEETEQIIKGEGGECAVLAKCDVSKPEQVNAMVAECEEALGPVSILVNNVGLTCPGDVTSVALPRWDLINAVNMDGVFNCTKAVLTSSLARGGATSIINISSISGIRALRSEVAYSASKSAVNAFTIAVAREFASRGIRCNCILPGIIETPLVHNAFAGQDMEKILAARNAQSPTGKMGDAWDIATAALYLASDDAKYTNGLIMPVDGGFSQQILPHCDGAPLLRPSPIGAASPASKFEGRVALVFGCGVLRKAISDAFERGGATVTLAPEWLSLGSADGPAKPDDFEAAVKKCVEESGRLDFLVNAPSIVDAGGLADTSYDDFKAAYARIATGTLLAMRFAVPQMQQHGQGSIVNVLSPAFHRYTHPQVAVAAASGCAQAITYQTAAEFADKGVRCNAVAPLVLDAGNLSAEAQEGFAADIANAVAYLSSDEARFTSGQVHNLDMSASFRVNVNF